MNHDGDAAARQLCTNLLWQSNVSKSKGSLIITIRTTATSAFSTRWNHLRRNDCIICRWIQRRSSLADHASNTRVQSFAKSSAAHFTPGHALRRGASLDHSSSPIHSTWHLRYPLLREDEKRSGYEFPNDDLQRASADPRDTFQSSALTA